MLNCATLGGSGAIPRLPKRWKKAFCPASGFPPDKKRNLLRFCTQNHWLGSCFLASMRSIKLTGRETTVVRAIGFTESMLGAEIQDFTRMEFEDVTDTLDGLIAAG